MLPKSEVLPRPSRRPSTPPPVHGQLKFGAEDAFYRKLRSRVDDYFERTGKSRRDCPQMYLKTVMVLVWFTSSYVLLVFVANTWWLAAILAVSLALSMAAIGFNIQHDGGHGAYSKRRWINRLTALSLDMLGGSSYGWACKHNIVHHTYANITRHDDDIDIGILGRLSPHQKYLPFHRWQHIYLWPLYGVVAMKWQLLDDFRDVARGQFGGQPHPRPKGWDLATFIGGKLLFFALAFVIPLLVHPVLTVSGFYLAIAFVQGMTLSMIFQLPHCVEKAAFPMPEPDTDRIEAPWAVHQVQTTVNYANCNRLLSWYVGGLNFQIEHHLFPRICHVHYSALALIVEQTCHEFGVNYQANETFRSALASHYRWLRRLGRPNNVAAE